jgi:hypothetical protein
MPYSTKWVKGVLDGVEEYIALTEEHAKLMRRAEKVCFNKNKIILG